MVDLQNDPAWLVTVTITTAIIAANADDAIVQVSETIGDELTLGDWGDMLPFDVRNIAAEEVEI